MAAVPSKPKHWMHCETCRTGKTVQFASVASRSQKAKGRLIYAYIQQHAYSQKQNRKCSPEEPERQAMSRQQMGRCRATTRSKCKLHTHRTHTQNAYMGGSHACKVVRGSINDTHAQQSHAVKHTPVWLQCQANPNTGCTARLAVQEKLQEHTAMQTGEWRKTQHIDRRPYRHTDKNLPVQFASVASRSQKAKGTEGRKPSRKRGKKEEMSDR